MRYLLHQHPAFPGLLSKADLYTLVSQGSLARGDLCTDVQTGRDHTVGEVIGGMKAPRAKAPPRVTRPAYQEFRADTSYEDRVEEERAVEKQVAALMAEEKTEAEEKVEEADEASFTSSGERIYFFGHPSWLCYWKSLFLMLLLLVGAALSVAVEEVYALVLALFAIAVWICIAMARSSRDYYVTEERVEYIWGILGRSSKEVRVCDIRSIDVWEKGLKGLLGLGTLDVSSAGNAGVEVRFQDIRKAHQVKELIRQLQRGDDPDEEG